MIFPEMLLEEGKIYTVSELSLGIKSHLEKNFSYVWVKGEVSDFSKASSGHIYFTLKDNLSRIRCVWFIRNQTGAGQKFDPLTGEVFDKPRAAPSELLKNGIEILCAGKISFYSGGGQCELIIEFVNPIGEGAITLEFERLKAKLFQAGYFDQANKKPLPFLPEKIALITSLHGAAIHDFLRISQNRGLAAKIRIFPVAVQGAESATQIAQAFYCINQQEWAQVIVLIRGGGSLEDLHVFNDEAIAEAIHKSNIPVLTGIGHEIDRSIADFTADVAAVTPTHAAQVLWPLQDDLWQRVDLLQQKLIDNMENFLLAQHKRLFQSCKLLNLLNPSNKIKNNSLHLKNLLTNLNRNFKFLLLNKEKEVSSLETALNKLSSVNQFILTKENKIAELQKKVLNIINNKIFKNEYKFDSLNKILVLKYKSFLDYKINKLTNLKSRLEALNPQMPLKRGFALLYRQDSLITSINHCHINNTLTIKLDDGELEVIVKNIKKN